MKWQILLDIKKSDFFTLENLLRSNDECSEFSLMEENDEYYLTSSHWESLMKISDVELKATKSLRDLSAIAMIHFPGFPPLKPDIICQVDEEGKRHRSVAIPDIVFIIGCDAYLQPEGGQDITHNLGLGSWMKLAEEDEIVNNVFRIITEFEHNWVNLYKVYEIVNKDARNKVKEWVTEKKIKQFTHTAQSPSAIGDDSRHGVDKTDPPKEPMALLEADSLIMTLLGKWFQWKCEQQITNN